MRHRKTRLRALGMALALTLCATGGLFIPAHAADQGDNGRGYGRQSDSRNNDQNDNGRNYDRRDSGNREGRDHQRIAIDNNDRQYIRSYMQGHQHRHCPPGLAKKHNGCLPPGHARRYEVGQRLPPDVTYVAVPYSLRHRLRPLQPGYDYIRVDDDVLLISQRDKTIVDAVTLLADLAR